MSSPSTVLPIRDSFRAITRAVVPASVDLDEEGWQRAERIVDDALLERPPSVRRQLTLFVRAVAVFARMRHGRPLGRLDPATARRFLGGFERSPILVVRRGFWGIRTLAYMGYYGQDEVRRALGYRAAAGGWEARGARQGAWPERGGAGGPESGTLTAEGEADGHA